jgi:hypothetical protein
MSRAAAPDFALFVRIFLPKLLSSKKGDFFSLQSVDFFLILSISSVAETAAGGIFGYRL